MLIFRKSEKLVVLSLFKFEEHVHQLYLKHYKGTFATTPFGMVTFDQIFVMIIVFTSHMLWCTVS